MGKPLRLIGQKFGRLTVIAKAGRNKYKGKLWFCECACGEYLIVLTGNLNHGDTKSCGCLRRDPSRKITHGKINTSEYRVWSSMKSRCFNKKDYAYGNYGGRGITVCDRWLKFENFIADIGKRPTNRHTIERVNNNGNYEPKNCIWATYTTNIRNRRTNKNNTTGFNGVSWDKKLKQFRARINANHKKFDLGCFKKLSDAIIARKHGELKYWGKLSND